MILQLSRPTARLEVVATSSHLDISERRLTEIVKDRVSATNKYTLKNVYSHIMLYSEQVPKDDRRDYALNLLEGSGPRMKMIRSHHAPLESSGPSFHRSEVNFPTASLNYLS